ncbi:MULTISPECIES: ATP-NAD kinase [Salinibaculum]|uniref:ATP-NAD kinase n=1 Tax=Salinibaculum TaxID=2732368 RepID=UPI0030CBCCB1
MADEADGTMRVGVVGDDASDAAAALTAAGAQPVVDDPATVLDAAPDAVVAVGEAGLLALVRRRPSVPVLPVDGGAGVRSVPAGRLDAAAGRLVDGDWTTERHPLLSVDADAGGGSLALYDAMAVTSEPAHISEFTVTAGDERVARFRADGLVVATPAGTRGYARAAGAPVIPPSAGVLAIVPVAPFATTLDHWVVPESTVSVTVERDDASVDVLADDRSVGVATVDDPVTVDTDGTVECVRLQEGQSPFAGPGRELEKL